MHEDIFFYHSDHLGSTSYITDAKANVTQFDAYLPFGELLVDEHSSTEEMPYKFNGKELDQETGLYYYGARYMNPKTSLWYGVDPLAEKYPSVYSYCYTFNNPVKIIDPDGKEPIKPQAGTAQGFVNKLNTTGTKSGTKHGKAAHNAMLGFGKMEFHFPRPLPANTGKINNYRDKYIYTTKGGWLDMAHFMFYAGKAYQYKIQKQEAKKQLEDTWGMAFLPIEMQREILKRSLQDPVGEAVQAGYFQEKTDEIVAKHSAYSYEDLPSDKFGAEFGANYFNPDSKLSLGEQLYNYLEGLGATDPQNSPNYQILPSKEPNKKPSRTNRTTTPVFTKKNP
jgi:YD repeat protein